MTAYPGQLNTENSSRVPDWLDFSGILLLVVLAAALRVALIDSQSLSMDELFDLGTVDHGWQGILETENRFPPLYHTFLNLWLQVFPGDATGRGFSVLCGSLLVCVVGLLGRAVAGRAAGFWAALLCASSPFALWYSLETRVYSFYLLLAALGLWRFVVTLDTDRPRDWFWFGLAGTAGIYTHYYFSLLVAMAAVVLILNKWRDWPNLWIGLKAFLVIGIVCLPVLWFLNTDLQSRWGFSRSAKFSLGALGYSFFSYASGYSLGPGLRELHTLGQSAAITRVAPWLAILGIPLATLFGFGIVRSSSPRWRMIVLCLGFLPVVVVGLATLWGPFGFNVRHTLWCQIPLIVTVAAGIVMARPRWLAGGCVTLLLGAWAIAIYQQHHNNDYRVEDARAAAAYLATNADRQEPLFVLAGYMEEIIAHYLPPSHQVVGLRDSSKSALSVADARALLVEALGEQSTFWLAYCRPFHGDPTGEILAAFTPEFHLELVRQVAGIDLYRGTFSAD